MAGGRKGGQQKGPRENKLMGGPSTGGGGEKVHRGGSSRGDPGVGNSDRGTPFLVGGKKKRILSERKKGVTTGGKDPSPGPRGT